MDFAFGDPTKVTDTPIAMPPECHDYEIEVTPSQHQVIVHPIDTSSTLQVIAGPGSGKTTTLVYKIAYMIGTLGLHPSEILVLSMTNKAVDALQSQLSALFGEEFSMDVITFHGFCHRCVIENDESQGKGIQIIEEAGWRTLVQLLRSKMSKYQLANAVESIKKDGWNQKEAEKLCRRSKASVEDLKDVMDTLESTKVLIHSDIMRAAKAFIKSGRVSLSYKVVIVDEFQDLYPDIYELVELVAKDAHLIVAGDPYQSIYKFLGSNQDVNTSVAKFKPIDKLYLQECFRSTPEIINASDKITMRENPSLALKEISGYKPVARMFSDITNQYEWIVKEIIRLMEESDGIIEPKDIAILARTNMELNDFKQVLNFYGVLDFKLSSSPPWLSNGLTHLIDYLRIMFAPETANFSVLCTMSLMDKIGPVAVKKHHKGSLKADLSMWDYLAQLYEKKTLTPHLVPYVERIQEVKGKIDFDDPNSMFEHLLYIGNELGLRKLVSKQIKSHADKDQITNQLLDFFENLKLAKSYKPDDITLAEHFLKKYQEVLPISKTKKCVNLSTIHSAKGLEFPIVFVLGSPSGDEYKVEARNLNYVAMTRAKSLLYINTMKVDGFSTRQFDKRFPSEFFTQDKPKIRGTFTTGFAKEFKKPIVSAVPRSTNFTRSFHTMSRLFKKL